MRDVLPNSYLQITLHPPQFDFKGAAPSEVRSAVWSSAEEAGFRDVKLEVHVAGGRDANADDNVRPFYGAVDEVNASLH